MLRDVPAAKFGTASMLFLAALVSAIATPLLCGRQAYQQSHEQQHYQRRFHRLASNEARLLRSNSHRRSQVASY